MPGVLINEGARGKKCCIEAGGREGETGWSERKRGREGLGREPLHEALRALPEA